MISDINVHVSVIDNIYIYRVYTMRHCLPFKIGSQQDND